jgi:HD-like signal output (HDOD) protein
VDPLEALLGQIENLPTLPDVHLRIVRQLDHLDCDLRRVAELIALDAVLSGRVIRMANSAVFGSAGRADSLKEAIQRLGTRDTRNVVMTAAIMDVLASRSSELDPREFWSLGLASALCARHLARDLGFKPVEQAYLGGLVHLLGEAVLALHRPERFARALEDARAHGRAAVESLWVEFGFTPAALCARLLENWNFPHAIVEAVEYQLTPSEAPNQPLLAWILLVADRMARELGFGTPDPGAAARSWVADVPREIAALLVDDHNPDLHAYLNDCKEELEGVSGLVNAVFSGR